MTLMLLQKVFCFDPNFTRFALMRRIYKDLVILQAACLTSIGAYKKYSKYIFQNID